MRRKLEGNEDEARRGRTPSKLPVWTEQTWHFQHVKKAFSRSKVIVLADKIVLFTYVKKE